MSQQQETEVYCYYAEGIAMSRMLGSPLTFRWLDTVERNILDLAARQGLSLYTKDNSAGTLHVSAFDLNTERKAANIATKKKVQKVQKGDFIFKSILPFSMLMKKGLTIR